MSKRNRVLIIGDAMIDTYIYGNVERVSPEAPVPVVCPSRKVNCLGGAANVAQNAASLGAEVMAVFVIGDDENGQTLQAMLESSGIDCTFLCRESEQRTIHKMRIVGNNQQIARIDWHDRYSLTQDTEKKLFSAVRSVIEGIDIIVLSDYGKGTCTERICRDVIRAARNNHKPVIVDPKGTSWEKYAGASIITPNLKEMNTFSGIKVPNISEEIETAYKDICGAIHIENVLLTRSEGGVTLLQEGKVSHFPAKAREVFDVSGAGDTVVAALASVLDVDMDNLIDSVEIANIAAGLAVAKPGTATVTLEEVHNEIARADRDEIRGKIYTEAEWDRLLQTVRFWRTTGDRIVTTNGCFDILHRGHIRLLEEAHKFGTRLIVAVNSDDSVKRLKGAARPINAEADRAYLVAALGMVDAVVLFDPRRAPYALSDDQRAGMSANAQAACAEAPMRLMALLSPDVHVKGGDYNLTDIPEAIFAKETKCVPFENGYSTTGTIQKTKTAE